jgi:hypothetical protein
MIYVGSRVRVIGQDITGTVVREHTGSKWVVLDDDRDMWRFDIEPEGEEGVLVYGASELEEVSA